MASFVESQKGKRRQRHIISVLMLILMGLGLVISLYLLRDVESGISREEIGRASCRERV